MDMYHIALTFLLHCMEQEKLDSMILSKNY